MLASRFLRRPFMTASCCRSASTRIPKNHSLQIPGLIKTLHKIKDRLSDDLDAPPVRMIVPGRMANTRGPSEAFTLKITTETEHGFKGLARLGPQVQEVFFVGGSRAALERAIARELPAGRGGGPSKMATIFPTRPPPSPRELQAENTRVSLLLARFRDSQRR
jgi:hypothetical protein